MDERIKRLRYLIREKSFNAGGGFTLASGKASDCFFDMKPTMLDPEGINLLADVFLHRIADEAAEHIGGVADGAVALVSVICAKSFGTRRPRRAFFVRNKQIEGNPPDKGTESILFEDVTSTGGSAMVAVDALRKIRRGVRTIYTIVDRREGAEARFAQMGIQLVPLFTKKDFTG